MIESIVYKLIMTFLLFYIHHLEYHKDLYLGLFYLTFVFYLTFRSHFISKCHLMVIVSKQMASIHNLGDKVISIRCNDKYLPQVPQVPPFRLLGTTIDSNLDWANYINKVIKDCFAKITTLKN